MSPKVSILRDWGRRPPRGGIAVVIDVIRFSTTVCALLRSGRRSIRVARDPGSLSRAEDLEFSDVFSELPFRSRGRRFDNSPHKAASSRGSRPAYVTTTTGSRAAFAASAADCALVGCFANFGALVRRLRRARRPVRLLPAASPPAFPGYVEDSLCAGAIADALRGDGDAGAKALARLRQSPRVAQFLRARPAWGHEDLSYCLSLDSLPVLPELVFPRAGEPDIARVRAARGGR